MIMFKGRAAKVMEKTEQILGDALDVELSEEDQVALVFILQGYIVDKTYRELLKIATETYSTEFIKLHKDNQL